MLKVFCRLNLLIVTESADCDRLMLRFLKNSKPPVEVGSFKKHETLFPANTFLFVSLVPSLTVYLCGGGRWRRLHLPGTDGFQESDHVPTEVPLALLQRRVE